MIAVDTSALVAIYLKEPDAEHIAGRLWVAQEASISAATVLELSIVLATRERHTAAAANTWIDQFIVDAGIAIEPVSDAQLKIARVAYVRYGKGMGHPAQLNFGDCFAYALAKLLDVPLLYKGDDFAKTDIASAL